jgi:hypothetical protein
MRILGPAAGHEVNSESTLTLPIFPCMSCKKLSFSSRFLHFHITLCLCAPQFLYQAWPQRVKKKFILGAIKQFLDWPQDITAASTNFCCYEWNTAFPALNRPVAWIIVANILLSTSVCCCSLCACGIPRRWQTLALNWRNMLGNILNIESSFWRTGNGKNTSFWIVYEVHMQCDLHCICQTLRVSSNKQNRRKFWSREGICPWNTKKSQSGKLLTCWVFHLVCSGHSERQY